MSRSLEATRRLVRMSIFTALVIVLQVVATFVKIGPFSITLALTPIVVGAALYGPKAGAWLGGAFGAVTLVMAIAGADPGGAVLWNVSPFATVVLCLLKGSAAGWFSGLVYKAVSRKSLYGGVIAAAVVSPVVNTGIFLAAMSTIYRATLTTWATESGATLVYFVFIGLAGTNFLMELGVNGVLAPIVARIIRIGKEESRA